MKVDIRDLGLRFIFGGLAVAACYVVLQLVPSKSFAGIFAAFPAVMAAAVIMAGHFGSSEQAADIALGASAGMLGCTMCVLTASFCMEHLNRWGLSLVIALVVWFVSSYAAIMLMQGFLEKRKRMTGKRPAGKQPLESSGKNP
ncbi:DUF3147 family protein [Methanosarcina sp. 1.H.A.2.2]|uniref:DUF3147 family protein n=1 Tax=Methanosarcina sp. 1.H.A.2.2 TaxID=1483601 RepID=UPI000622A32C|nr:DUF3147 family protein [Methanosarcina sp. 1.H.A.2.2]KKH47320.1 membrane protein [Methanosarcina sp. 1.H.A.2.2]